MYGTGTKKMLNMLILDILKEYSDSEHRLLQQDKEPVEKYVPQILVMMNV